MINKYLLEEIDWDTNLYWNGLPRSLHIWIDEDPEEKMDGDNSIAPDWLSDHFGYCVNSVNVKAVENDQGDAPNGAYLILTEWKRVSKTSVE